MCGFETLVLLPSTRGYCYGARASGRRPTRGRWRKEGPRRRPDGSVRRGSRHLYETLGRHAASSRHSPSVALDHRRSQMSARRAPFAASRTGPGSRAPISLPRGCARRRRAFCGPPICCFSGEAAFTRCHATRTAPRPIVTPRLRPADTLVPSPDHEQPCSIVTAKY